jgi:hypothetical protein
MAVFGSMMGFSVVLLLWIEKKIDSYYFYQYIFSQIAFFIAFLSGSKTVKMKNHLSTMPVLTNRHRYIYIYIATIYIISNLVVYKISGIPIFKESRLAAVMVGGGFGVFIRIISIYDPLVSYLTFHFLFMEKNKKFKIFPVFMLLVIIVVGVLSGSRSSFLGTIQNLFLYLFLNREYFGDIIEKLKKFQIPIMLLSAVGAISIIILQTRGSIETAFNALIFRIVGFGDVYYLSYPNNIIDLLSGTNIFIVLFGDMFRMLRILPEYFKPPGIGFEIYNLANKTVDVLAGPNPRHNIYGYVNFGFVGSLWFSFFCGVILNVLRGSFLTNKDKSLDKKMVIYLLYLTAIKIETDPPAFIAGSNNIIIFFSMVVVVNNILKNIKASK